MPSNDQASALDVLDDGAILVSGMAYAEKAHAQAAVVKLSASGQHDTSFAADGVALHPSCGTSSWLYLADTAIDALGSIVLAGTASGEGPEEEQVCVARLHANGTADTSFGDQSHLLFDFSPGLAGSADWVSSIAITYGNAILIGGHTESSDALLDGNASDNDFKIARLKWQ